MSSDDRQGYGDQRRPATAEDTTAMQLQDRDTTTAALHFPRPDTAPDAAPDTAPDTAPAVGGSAASAPPAADWGEEAASRAPVPRVGPRADARGARPGRRRARLGLTRIDPWSVFVLSLVVSLFLGVVLLVAVAVLYALLDGLGVLSSVDTLVQELDLIGDGQPLFGLGRVLGATAVIAAVDIVLLTVLATLGAFLYNLCAALTGGIEVTLTERD